MAKFSPAVQRAYTGLITTALKGPDKVLLAIEHIATGKAIILSGIKLRNFADRLDTKTNEEMVYGRMDPIVTYQGTSRSISMGFDLGSGTETEMKRALQSVSALMKFQYPVYGAAGDALTIQRPPMLKIKFSNYISATSGGPLLCYMNGMSYAPIDGMGLDATPYVDKEGKLTPKRISIDLELTILHDTDSPPGWTTDDKTAAFLGGFLNLPPVATKESTAAGAEADPSEATDVETETETGELVEALDGNGNGDNK